MRSFDGRAEIEVDWRRQRNTIIASVAKWAGMDAGRFGSELSKRILGGRRRVFRDGELVGYGSRLMECPKHKTPRGSGHHPGTDEADVEPTCEDFQMAERLGVQEGLVNNS